MTLHAQKHHRCKCSGCLTISPLSHLFKGVMTALRDGGCQLCNPAVRHIMVFRRPGRKEAAGQVDGAALSGLELAAVVVHGATEV